MYRPDDTIAAIATPVGSGGIGIIKISGPLAEDVLRRMFRPSNPPERFTNRHLYHGTIVDPIDGQAIDEVLLSLTRKPHTYTREDVAEINCHSGYIVLQKILSAVLSCGIRLAEPGEFTKRAFLNGRIDLTQAEAVIEVINAGTSQALKMANDQLRGMLCQKLSTVQSCLLDVLSILEVAIDFPDEDTEILQYQDLVGRLQDEALNPIGKLLDSYGSWRMYREGASVVLIGRPNVGKSSLLNALLEEQRAIVTDIPGTTRDVIEEQLNIQGIPIRVMDTAGLGEAQNEIEEIGISLTNKNIELADLILLVVDGSKGFDPEDYEIAARLQNRAFILVLNKMDLGLQINPEKTPPIFFQRKTVAISALEAKNIDLLKEAMFGVLMGDKTDLSNRSVVPNARHYAVLAKILPLLLQAKNSLENGISPDLIAIDIQEAMGILGEITGQTTPEDILDHIFSQFCLGK